MIDPFWTCLRFYTRLPTPAVAGAHAPPDFDAGGWAVPLVGALVGALGGAALLIALRLGLSPTLAATLAVATLALVTGGLHEDGLADFIDGIGGGATSERKLEIMRDSRLGAYGALALCLTSLLRVFALSALAQTGGPAAGAALTFAGAVSRSAGLLPMSLLAPARPDGAGAAVTPPSPRALGAMAGKALLIAVAPLLSGASPLVVALAFLLGYATSALIARVASRQIGGYTGDVLGAAQQTAEIVVLLTLSASH
jgi:adenosylcobinamide-GDP ribazoletransferase